MKSIDVITATVVNKSIYLFILFVLNLKILLSSAGSFIYKYFKIKYFCILSCLFVLIIE
jgi:hypothetical protein